MYPVLQAPVLHCPDTLQELQFEAQAEDDIVD